MTFTRLFEEAGIPRVDMLQVDAEGYDHEVLRLFEIPTRRPAIIRFEHKHLRPADYGQAIGMLVDLGVPVHSLRREHARLRRPGRSQPSLESTFLARVFRGVKRSCLI